MAASFMRSNAIGFLFMGPYQVTGLWQQASNFRRPRRQHPTRNFQGSGRNVCQSGGTLSVLRCHLKFALESLTFFTITTFRTFCHLSVICFAYSGLKIVSQQQIEINSWKFSCDDLLRLSTWIIKTRMHRSTYFHFCQWSPILCHCETLV